MPSSQNATLVLRLAGPLQSWGTRSHYTVREAGAEPSKSGILGMCAAALGRRRIDPLEDLLQLRFGVRIDQSGQPLEDFHTARRTPLSTKGSVESMPLSRRHYLSDAVFLACLEGESELVEGIKEALLCPRYPLFLGRRSCPPAGQVVLGVRDTDVKTTLAEEMWAGNPRRIAPARLQVVRDADAEEARSTQATERDVPVSFSPHRRLYSWRPTVRYTVPTPLPQNASREIDFLAELEVS